MMDLTLMQVAKTKKRGVREAIIDILSGVFPLSVRKIYAELRCQTEIHVTYQAVFKSVKDLVAEGILIQQEKEYRLNISWVNYIKNEIKAIERKYLGQDSKESAKERVNAFVSELGYKIKEYLGNDSACVIGLGSGGKIYGPVMWKYLLNQNQTVDYAEYDPRKIFPLPKQKMENKKIIVVSGSAYSGNSYLTFLEKINPLKAKLKIKDIKFAVDQDMAGIADFAVSKF